MKFKDILVHIFVAIKISRHEFSSFSRNTVPTFFNVTVSYSLLSERGKKHEKIGRILSIFKMHISIRKLEEERDKPDKLSRARTTYMFDTVMKISRTIHNIMKVEFSFYLCLSYLSNLFFPLRFCYYLCYRIIKVYFLLSKSA